MINSIRFYLLGFKGFLVLQEVIHNYGSFCINEVIIGKDKGVENDFSTEIENLCTIEKISFKTRLTDVECVNMLSIAIGWRWIIDIKRVQNLVILHDSLLPKYRGFNPLVSALINGEKKIGVTSLFASENYDEGDIIYQSEIEIQYPIKINYAIIQIANCYVDVVKKILNDCMSGQILPRYKQDDRYATYSLWRDENDYKINWNDSNERIQRFINSVGMPYKGAITQIDNRLYIINESELIDDRFIENRCPGKVIFFDNEFPVVVCGSGLLKILEITDFETNIQHKIKSIRTRFK